MTAALPYVEAHTSARVITYRGRTWAAYRRSRWDLGAGWNLADDRAGVTSEMSWADVVSRVRGVG